MINEQFSKVS